MVEKILNINIDDENSGKIAEILRNKTCKKILGLIADKDSISEGDIVRELKIPANTANYNIKKLILAGFIEETKTWFWSVKGKKIKTYRLANKKIIISTKNSFKSLLIASFVTGLAGLVVKIGMNYSKIYNFSNVQNTFMEKSGDLAYSAAPVLADAPLRFTQVSIFQNVLTWFIIGCLVGLLGFILYKKIVKGGSLK